MKKAACMFLLFLQGWNAFAQMPPLIQWQRALGGTGDDYANGINTTSNGEYLVVGSSGSNNGDASGNHGGFADGWVVKLDLNGDLQWQKLYGGTRSDYLISGTQAADGNWVLIGGTASNDGDVSGPDHGLFYDMWIIQINSAGTLMWQKKIGGSYNDDGWGVNVRNDGSIRVAGNAGYQENGDSTGDLPPGHGYTDFWLVKLSDIGMVEWQHSYGGSLGDVLFSLCPTVDGGNIMAGYSNSTDGDVTNYHGDDDAWVVKTDSAGTLQWQKTLGGSDTDQAYDIKRTNDGAYVVAGATYSLDGDIIFNHGGNDAWVVKLGSGGELLWQNTIGGPGNDAANSIQQTADGGFIVAGSTSSNSGDVVGNHGGYDAWVVKLDSTGGLKWQMCAGGSGNDGGGCIRQTPDGGFILAGSTESNNGDVSGNHGGRDAWVVKLGPEQPNGILEQVAMPGLEVFPLPARGAVNIRYPLGQGSPFRIEVLDAMGRVVLVPFLSRAASGPDVWQFDAAPLAPGTYLLRLITNGQVHTGKLVRE